MKCDCKKEHKHVYNVDWDIMADLSEFTIAFSQSLANFLIANPTIEEQFTSAFPQNGPPASIVQSFDAAVVKTDCENKIIKGSTRTYQAKIVTFINGQTGPAFSIIPTPQLNFPSQVSGISNLSLNCGDKVGLAVVGKIPRFIPAELNAIIAPYYPVILAPLEGMYLITLPVVEKTSLSPSVNASLRVNKID